MADKLSYLGDDHLVAIAHVAIRSAQMDQTIELALAEILISNLNTAEMVLKTWPQNRQIKLLQSLLRDGFPRHITEVDDFINKIEATRTERNKIIHFIWGKVDPEGAAFLTSFRPFRKDQIDSKTAPEVQAVADTMHDRVNDLYKVIYIFREQRIQSRQKHALPHSRKSYPWPLTKIPQNTPRGP